MPALKLSHHQRHQLSLRKVTRFTPDQVEVLERQFSLDPYPALPLRAELAKLLRVTERQVMVWFQNARSRRKDVT